MKIQSKKVLELRLERLELSLTKERTRLNKVIGNIGWGAGMRRTKCTPSFRREDELKEKIAFIKSQLKEIK